MTPIAIRVQGLGKRYRIGSREASYDTLRDFLSSAVSSPWRRLSAVLRGESAAAARRTLWALKGLDFEVRAGEVVGVIGRNGAGKSTLLKVLSRITPPTEGRAEIRGRVSSLLEVGTGFHPELTGRENIYLNGAILGMGRAEIARKFDEIVDFAEVGRFIETPVKFYSSGMYVRLAFAVAAHLEPDIMLVDEVLAVGDAAFQEKCLGKLNSVTRQGRTVLFVSHNMAAVRRLCSRAILLEEGRVGAIGEAAAVIHRYLAKVQGAAIGRLDERRRETSRGELQAVAFRAAASSGGPPRSASPAEFRVGYRSSGRVSHLHAAVAVKDPLGVTVFVCSTRMKRSALLDLPPSGEVRCLVDWLPLVPGRYFVDIKLTDGTDHTDLVREAAAFTVLDGGESGFLEYPTRHVDGSIVVPHQWAPVRKGEAGPGEWDGEDVEMALTDREDPALT